METKKKILIQTFDLVMKYGIKSVSMDDISSGIGISKKTIYQYFENKQSLISEMIDNHISKDEMEIKEIINQSNDAILEVVAVARHMLAFLRGMSPSMIFDTKKFYPLQWKKIQTQHFSFIHDINKANIERGQKEGLYHNDINAEIISRLHVRQLLALADEDIFPLKDYNRGELYKTLIVYHIRGLMTEKGKEIAKSLELE